MPRLQTTHAALYVTAFALAGLSLMACGGDEIAPPPPPAPTFNDKTLSAFDLGPQSSSTPFGFELGSGALGFTLHAQFPLHAGFESLRAPNGDFVIEAASIPGTDAKFRAYPVFADITGPYDVLAGVPQSDAASAMPPTGGYWELTLRDQIGTAIALDNVRVLVRFFKSGTFDGGRVDVNAFIAGKSTNQSDVLARLQAAFTDFAGLTLGNVTYFDLEQASEIIDDEVEFRELLRGAADHVGPDPALNVVFVKDMSKLFAVAKAGGQPGLTVWHGSNIGGIAVETSTDPKLDSLVLRHEIGHMAGLLHTTERTDSATKGLTDALADTASCDDTLQLSFCPDSANVMFPIPTSNWSGELSPSQMAVVQGSALYIGDDGQEVENQAQSHHDGHPVDLQASGPARAQWQTASEATGSVANWRAAASELRPTLQHDLLSFCGHSTMVTRTTHSQERAPLRGIAADPNCPSYVRRRAAQLLARP